MSDRRTTRCAMTEPEPSILNAEDRPPQESARTERLYTALIAKWLLFAILGILIVLGSAWPFRVDLLNRFGPETVRYLLDIPVTFTVTRADFDRIEVNDIAIAGGPAARTVSVALAMNASSTPILQRVQVDGLRLKAAAGEQGLAIDGFALPAADVPGGDVSVPVHELILTDLQVEIESPLGTNRIVGDVDLTFPAAPGLFPVTGRVRLEDRVSQSALLAEFRSGADSVTASGTADLSLGHWLPLAPQVIAAQGRATARFDLAMLGQAANPTPDILSGGLELAWTGARVSPKDYPDLVLADGIVEMRTDGEALAIRMPQSIEIGAARVPDALLALIPDHLLPYLTGAPQVVLDGNSDAAAVILRPEPGGGARLDFDMTTALTLGPIAAEIEPVSLTLDRTWAPTFVFLRRAGLSLLRGVDLPRDLAAHLELGAAELDVATLLTGEFPRMEIPYRLEGTLTGTVLDPLWVRQATFRGEGLASIAQGMAGIAVTVEPGGQIRADGLTGTGDLRLSPNLRLDVAGRDPLRVSADFDDPEGSLAVAGTFRIGEMSVALPSDDGSTPSLVFGRQPASVTYKSGALGLALGPVDIQSPDLDLAANRTVIRAQRRGETGSLSVQSAELISQGRPFATGAASASFSVSIGKDGTIAADGPISIAGGAIAARTDLVHSARPGGSTTLKVTTEPVRFGPDGTNLSDLLPAFIAIRLPVIPDLDGTVSASLDAAIQDGAISGELAVNLTDLAVETPDGDIRGLNGPILFDLGRFPATKGMTQFSATARMPGLGSVPVAAKFTITPDAAIAIHNAELSVFGGSIALIDAVADPSATSLNGTIRMRRISLHDAIDLIDIEGVEATGQVSGLLPIRVTSGDAIIQGGSVGAEGGGVLKIDNPSVNQALASDEETVQMMTDVLKDFHYDSLNAEVDLPPGRDGKILLSLGGRNPAVLDGHPFRLNITLESDFRKLFSILRNVLNLSSTILGRRGDG
ncbi:MAG: YdbH domain-containing protein [Alphaproteobacteria bacterium]